MDNNNTPNTNTNNSNEIIDSFKKVLSEFPVQIYNGKDNPITVPLPQAFTNISGDVKTLKLHISDIKTDVTELKSDVKIQGDLLSGIKKRREIKKYFKDIWTLLRSFTIIRVMMWILLHLSALIGLTEIVMKIFFHKNI